MVTCPGIRSSSAILLGHFSHRVPWRTSWLPLGRNPIEGSAAKALFCHYVCCSSRRSGQPRSAVANGLKFRDGVLIMASNAEKSACPTKEQISERAFQIYQTSGCAEGHDMENWLEAERQLLTEGRPTSQIRVLPQVTALPAKRSTGHHSPRRASAR